MPKKPYKSLSDEMVIDRIEMNFKNTRSPVRKVIFLHEERKKVYEEYVEAEQEKDNLLTKKLNGFLDIFDEYLKKIDSQDPFTINVKGETELSRSQIVLLMRLLIRKHVFNHPERTQLSMII